MEIVMMNTKKKMNIHDAITWHDCSELTLIKATRVSNRGTKEQIYLLGAGTYRFSVGDHVPYVTDTGNGYGGRGYLMISDMHISGKQYSNKIMTTSNILDLNEVIKLPLWVMK